VCCQAQCAQPNDPHASPSQDRVTTLWGRQGVEPGIVMDNTAHGVAQSTAEQLTRDNCKLTGQAQPRQGESSGRVCQQQCGAQQQRKHGCQHDVAAGQPDGGQAACGACLLCIWLARLPCWVHLSISAGTRGLAFRGKHGSSGE
jgi:hypothetical protein